MDKPADAVRAAIEIFAEHEASHLDPPRQPNPTPAFDFSMYTVKKPPKP